jgi:hypothetical protein
MWNTPRGGRNYANQQEKNNDRMRDLVTDPFNPVQQLLKCTKVIVKQKSLLFHQLAQPIGGGGNRQWPACH